MANAHDILSRGKADYNIVNEKYYPSVYIYA